MPRHRSHLRPDPTGPELDRLRRAYADSDVPVREIERRFGVHSEKLMALARREGWKLRRPSSAGAHHVDAGATT